MATNNNGVSCEQAVQEILAEARTLLDEQDLPALGELLDLNRVTAPLERFRRLYGGLKTLFEKKRMKVTFNRLALPPEPRGDAELSVHEKALAALAKEAVASLALLRKGRKRAPRRPAPKPRPAPEPGGARRKPPAGSKEDEELEQLFNECWDLQGKLVLSTLQRKSFRQWQAMQPPQRDEYLTDLRKRLLDREAQRETER